MQHTTTNRHPGTRHSVTAAFGSLAGIIVMIASRGCPRPADCRGRDRDPSLGDHPREIEHRVRNGAELASVARLRPALTDQRDLKTTSQYASWRGPSAA